MKEIVLASNSPRRKELMEMLGIGVRTFTLDVPEEVPGAVAAIDAAKFLAEEKNRAYRSEFGDEIVLTADTMVIYGEQLMGKPTSETEANKMLTQLSGAYHRVVSGVCISNASKCLSFDDTTLVHFRALSRWEIDYYVRHYQPMDKAGAYGIQEWIGMIGIDKIDGSYYNVMGLPVHQVYSCLRSEFDISPTSQV